MLQVVGKTLRRYKLSETATTICQASLSPSTTSQYDSHLNDFKRYCQAHGIRNHLTTTVVICIEYLTSLYTLGKSYSTINSARSALSQFVQLEDCSHHNDFGKHPLTLKFMKGVYKLRPPKSKYRSTWDVKLVLDYLRKLKNDTACLKALSFKCAMLLALATGQRVQTLTALELSQIVEQPEKITFCVNKILKTSKPGVSHQVEVFAFHADKAICPLICLRKYIERTHNIRGATNQLFISFQKPNGAVTSQTISRWLTTTLHNAGVNCLFTAHSTRGAASSKAALIIDINAVLKQVGWRSERTFARHYQKTITKNDIFSNAVLATL